MFCICIIKRSTAWSEGIVCVGKSCLFIKNIKDVFSWASSVSIKFICVCWLQTLWEQESGQSPASIWAAKWPRIQSSDFWWNSQRHHLIAAASTKTVTVWRLEKLGFIHTLGNIRSADKHYFFFFTSQTQFSHSPNINNNMNKH